MKKYILISASLVAGFIVNICLSCKPVTAQYKIEKTATIEHIAEHNYFKVFRLKDTSNDEVRYIVIGSNGSGIDGIAISK